MFEGTAINSRDKPVFYEELRGQLSGLLDGERDAIANGANMAALIYHMLPELNWAGLYFLRMPGELVLGPFQGKSACVWIAVGRGVCGTAVERRASVLVEDVHDFPGHIACDAASRSELVIPLIYKEIVLGVFDLDSPRPGRFEHADQVGMETLATTYIESCDWRT